MATFKSILEVLQFIATAIASWAGIMSAFYWTKTADVPIPLRFDTRGQTFLGGKRDHTQPQKLDPMYEALRDQGIWNSKAARKAAVAAGAAAAAFNPIGDVGPHVLHTPTKAPAILDQFWTRAS